MELVTVFYTDEEILVIAYGHFQIAGNAGRYILNRQVSLAWDMWRNFHSHAVPQVQRYYDSKGPQSLVIDSRLSPRHYILLSNGCTLRAIP